MGQYPKQEQNPGHWIESSRVAPVIQRWLDDHAAKHDGGGKSSTYFGRKLEVCSPQISSAGPVQTLAFMSGVNVRRINGICRTEYKYVSLDVVDRLFTGMDLNYLFTLPPEQDGFSDVYFHPSVVSVLDEEALAA